MLENTWPEELNDMAYDKSPAATLDGPTDWAAAENAISAATKRRIMAHRPISIPEPQDTPVPFLIRFAERPPLPMAGNRTHAGCTGTNAEDYLDDDR